MPVVDAYKNGDLIIPVNNAKLVKAYLCPFTNSVYSEKKKYIKHLQDYRENVIRTNILWNNMNNKLEDLYNQSSWESVISWIENNSRFFLERVILSKQLNPKKIKNRAKFKIKITYLNIRYSSKISNTHSSPRGMPTNWRQTDDLPKGYPGWSGQIEFTTSSDVSSIFMSDLFDDTGINTGSGGGTGNNRYGYSIKFFEADWPGIEKKRLLDILANKPYNEFKFGTAEYFGF